MSKDLKQMYKTIMDDNFTPQMEVAFVDGNSRQTLFYEKVSWVIEGVNKGLRYGENPGQEAALYRLVNGNLTLGKATTILPGRHLVSDIEIAHPIQQARHGCRARLGSADRSDLSRCRVGICEDPVPDHASEPEPIDRQQRHQERHRKHERQQHTEGICDRAVRDALDRDEGHRCETHGGRHARQ